MTVRDEEIVEAVVEAYSLDNEMACTPEEWRKRINLDQARLWFDQAEKAEAVLARYHKAAARARRAGRVWSDLGPGESRKHQRAAFQVLQTRCIREAWSKRYSQEIDECGRLSRGMVDWPPAPRQPKTQPDPARLAAYWLRKVYRTEYLLGRAQGRLERLERPPAPDAITTSFHLGMVGGSGKQVLKLNRQRERAVESDLRKWRQLQAARERVAMLESRLARFTEYYQKWEEQI